MIKASVQNLIYLNDSWNQIFINIRGENESFSMQVNM